MPQNIDLIRNFLLQSPRLFKRILMLSSDIFICSFSVWLAFLLRNDQWGTLEGNQWLVLICAIIFSVSSFYYFGHYRIVFRYSGSHAFLSLTRSSCVIGALSFLLFSIIGIDGIPRSIGVIQPILLFLLYGTTHYLIRKFLIFNIENNNSTKDQITNALIYGVSKDSRNFASSMKSNTKVLIKGFIDSDTSLQKNTIDGVRVYGPHEIITLTKQLQINNVFVDSGLLLNHDSTIFNSLIDLNIRVRKIQGLNKSASMKVGIEQLFDLDTADLLDRRGNNSKNPSPLKSLYGKVILVSGAGGSIGSELCRQIICSFPKEIVLVDISEHALYLINQELSSFNQIQVDPVDSLNTSKTKILPIITPYLASVRDQELIHHILNKHQPHTVFHAAAYKHVPLVEKNPIEGIRNNVYGTRILLEESIKHKVDHFILISTDKAVRPTNIMGASKRIAEMLLQALAENSQQNQFVTKMSMVRFGNVLDSSGSVVPLYKEQIQNGGPLTVTHPEVTRFFMTIPEAANLVLQSTEIANNGDLLMLDMGEPQRIYDLAKKLVFLSGNSLKTDLNPDGDIEIQFTGLRPGEKLYEELLIGGNPEATTNKRIFRAKEDFLPLAELEIHLQSLNDALNARDFELLHNVLLKLVEGYNKSSYESHST
jgi:FlaA1/EpsC-like NDP-sugar epimerase